MSTPPALEVKYFSGKCQGCERTLTEAVAPSLSNCLCASPRIPPLGALLDAGSRGGRSPSWWPPDPAKMWQRRSAGTAPAPIPAAPPPAEQNTQPLLPPNQGFKHKAAATGNVCLQACLLVQKCCNLLMETGGMREENGNVIKNKQQQGDYWI